MSRPDDNSNSEKEKEGTKRETSVKQELTEWGGRPQTGSKGLCLQDQRSDVATSKTGIQGEELVKERKN